MKLSAGILLYRIRNQAIQFFLVHPGGPFYAKKEMGVWMIPKGELAKDEDPLAAAIREFQEETGHQLSGDFTALNPIVQKGGKKVFCWAIKGDADSDNITSNHFEMEWPPHSGQMQSFPEVDKAGWFDLEDAKLLINEKQVSLLEEVWLKETRRR